MTQPTEAGPKAEVPAEAATPAAPGLETAAAPVVADPSGPSTTAGEAGASATEALSAETVTADSRPERKGKTKWSFPRAKLPGMAIPRLAAFPRPDLSRLRQTRLRSVSRPAVAAAALLVAVGGGYAAGRMTGVPSGELDAALQRLNGAAAELRHSQDAATRLGGEIKTVKASVDTLKGERERSRGELLARQEKAEKVAAEAAAKIARLTEQVERVEKAGRDPARVSAILERLDRLDGRISTVQTGAPAAPTTTASTTPTPPPKPGAEPVGTGSLPDPKPVAAAKPAETDPRRTQIEGFVLRDIDDGVALIEGRNGRFYEVSRGMNLPGLGRVEALERRGRHWVVVTPKGFIGER